MSSLKCDQTGHFLGYYPEHDIGFTCFECLEEFGPSGRRAVNSPFYAAAGLSRESRKRRSLHLPPPPPSQVSEEPISERDEFGRRRSKPWRCLQQKCKLLACDGCAENLIDPEYISQARDRDSSELTGKRNSIVGGEARIRAGAATPPDQRASRELRDSTREPTATTASIKGSSNMATGDPGKLETDSEGSDDDDEALDGLRTKLVYRRAGHVATSALAHYHHRDSARAPIPNRIPVKAPPIAWEEVPRPPTVVPQHLQSAGNNMACLEVDSNEGSDGEEDFLPPFTIRSASQAANQAMRTAHWRQRAAGLAAASRLGKV